MQTTADGFVGGPNNEQDWLTMLPDDKFIAFRDALTNSMDTIIAGRKMSEGWAQYWEGVPPDSPWYAMAQKIVNTPKIVFSKTISELPGKNVRVENGDLVQAVKALKKLPGKNIIVYGGASFVASLIEHGLIDEYYFVVNPTAIGDGKRVFNQRTELKFVRAKSFRYKAVLIYKPKK
jgi:dihydrofolate reductase